MPSTKKNIPVKCEVIQAVLLNIQVFRDVTPREYEQLSVDMA